VNHWKWAGIADSDEEFQENGRGLVEDQAFDVLGSRVNCRNQPAGEANRIALRFKYLRGGKHGSCDKLNDHSLTKRLSVICLSNYDAIQGKNRN